MQLVMNESERRQMYLTVLIMQIFVDIYICASPLISLGHTYHAHIWTLPWPMLEAFVVALFYDLLLKINNHLWNPFGIDMDDLSLDPVLITTERSSFFNLGRSEQEDLPAPLKKMWAATKEEK